MHFASLKYPIPYHPTWDVIDSTKLQTFLTCPREFFFKYILGWRNEHPNEHLAFGSAWHDAIEILMRHQTGEVIGYNAEVLARAAIAFQKTFKEKMGQEEAEELGGLADLAGYSVTENRAKNIGNGIDALIEYAARYRRDHFKTLYTEVSGVINIHDDRHIFFKLDSILDGQDQEPGIWSFEHKTTGRKTQAWQDQWPLMPQIGTYSHVLYTFFGDDATGLKINGAVIRAPKADGKSNNEFLRLPIHITRDLMMMWLWETNKAFADLEWNMQMLSKASPSDKIMQAFPRNGTSCSKNFNGCPFAGLCSTWANPLKHADNPPPGYRVDHWDPRSREEDTFNLETVEQGNVKATAKKVG